MKILALESSATAASVALCEDERLIAQSFLHCGLTHSETLLPLIQQLLENCGLTLAQMDLLAVAAGPGSFTGLRIGVATAKGLAFARSLPCVACSTLEAMAYNAIGLDGELWALMDARRSQMYHARFCSDGAQVERLCEDQTSSLAELAERLERMERAPYLLGDGAELAQKYFAERGCVCPLAPQNLRMQAAFGVAQLALMQKNQGDAGDAAALRPNYLRTSQAERERAAREAVAEQPKEE